MAMENQELRHVFGPVPSRRLGASLGIDVVRFKTCSYDCVYCQLGRTTDHCAAAAEAVSPEEVVAEVRAKLAAGPRPDWITFSGSGEPTLYPRLGELITLLKPLGVPVAVITNGSLLWREEAAAACALADLVSPTLVAGSEDAWRRVNRPHGSIGFAQMADGLVRFRERFRGKLWLEVMLVAGLNDSEEEVRHIAELAGRIRPDRVQLNTVTRPPAEESALAVSPERLAQIAARFDPPAEIIAEFRGFAGDTRHEASENEVLELLRRRPCTVDDVAMGLGLRREEALRLLERLAAGARAVPSPVGSRIYFKAATPDRE